MLTWLLLRERTARAAQAHRISVDGFETGAGAKSAGATRRSPRALGSSAASSARCPHDDTTACWRALRHNVARTSPLTSSPRAPHLARHGYDQLSLFVGCLDTKKPCINFSDVVCCPGTIEPAPVVAGTVTGSRIVSTPLGADAAQSSLFTFVLGDLCTLAVALRTSAFDGTTSAASAASTGKLYLGL